MVFFVAGLPHPFDDLIVTTIDRNARLDEPAHGEARRFSTRPRLAGDLTPREPEGLRLIGPGITSYEIGRTLKISDKPVDKLMGAVLGKLGGQSCVDAAVWDAERWFSLKARRAPDAA